jgi:CheY-like chemotaxis protein
VGLTLVKKLVELHGGSVRAESPGEGAGSRFTVRLPLTAPSRPEPVGGEKGVTHEEAALLFVEDNADAREMTTELLRLSGYRVTAVANGLDALRAARSQTFVAAVIDIGLPDIDGYELARQLRQAPETRGLGLVALTGYGLASDIQCARDAGFDHHLVKPVNHQKLVQAIENARASRSHTA